MTAVAALDISSTATGVAFGPLLDDELLLQTIAAKGDLHERCRSMAEKIAEYAGHWRPDLIVVEAIGTRHVSTAIAIATAHALILDRLGGRWPLLFVAPAALKKWATGKGNASKHQMTTAALNNGCRLDNESTDDQADAWWLHTLGRAALGCWDVPETAYRRVVLDALTTGEPQ